MIATSEDLATWEIRQGDCREVMRGMESDSVDAIVCDPPYGLSFMGKSWDHGVPGVEFWVEALRVAKPGAHLLAFGGTRTYHRLACAIEDAGWEIRDCVMWVYGSGFPKSADVSKMLDKQERDRWLKVCKAIDTMAEMSILEAWQEYSSNAKSAGLTFQKSVTETGMSTLKSGSVPASAALLASHGSSIASAITAELSSSAALHTSGETWSFVPLLAGVNITELSDHANIAESQPEDQEVTPDTEGFSVPLPAWGLQGERITDRLKADEALKIWLGSGKSSKAAATNALCAALTDDLKRIILSQSETFLSLDTTQQTDFVSATTATITASTAASLISFTVGILKSKAIDKAAGAEREVVSEWRTGFSGTLGGKAALGGLNGAADVRTVTSPATPAAKQWAGWGTALKPAHEPIVLARKPLGEGTVAGNVMKWGTGGINVDGCRVDGAGKSGLAPYTRSTTPPVYGLGRAKEGRHVTYTDHALGRWPANFIHDGSDEVVGLFPTTTSGTILPHHTAHESENRAMGGKNYTRTGIEFYGDSGSASRFFYCAKASKRDRDEGCEGLPVVTHQSGLGGARPVDDDGKDRDRFKAQSRNHHPTIKPISLMRYLCRLVTPPGGVVLDPFCGSGSTGKGAILEGFRFIGIEQEPEYVEIAKHRIAHAAQEQPRRAEADLQMSVLETA